MKQTLMILTLLIKIKDCTECKDIRIKVRNNEIINNKINLEDRVNTISINKDRSTEVDRLKNLDSKTLPPSESAFEEQLELDSRTLDKKLSIEDADYSECPPQYIH